MSSVTLVMGKEVVTLLVMLVLSVMSAPSLRVSRRDTGDASKPDLSTPTGQMEYLRQFNWLGEGNPDKQVASLTEDEQVFEAIKEFQKFAGLPMTGNIDDATVKKMEEPRCGNADNVNMASLNKRRKRYALQGSRWNSNTLSYRINRNYYTPDLERTKVDEIIKDAFDAWSKVTPLKFVEKSSGRVDMDIEFRAGEHGDNNPFDGQGGTLAHAYFPEFGGNAHFDESEWWSHQTSQGTNLFQVAVHEFGHSLGLGHSDVQSAIMAPFYGGYDSSFTLDDDDITAIQALYGKPSSPTTPSAPTAAPTKSPTSRPAPDICRDGSFDAITNSEDLHTGVKKTYAFRGDKYMELTATGIAANYPRSISDDWGDLPSNLDAALHWPTSSQGSARTYFFKGDEFYKFETRNGKHELLPGYPRQISNGFSGLPNDIDAAFVWSGNGKTYFIKGDKYYRYKRGTGIDQGYPKTLDVWDGLPERIDAAFEWTNDRTYFFNGPNYYRFNDQQFTVDRSYPRLNSVWWLGCPEETGGQMAEVEETEMDEETPVFIEVETVDSASGAKTVNTASLSFIVSVLVTSLITVMVL